MPLQGHDARDSPGHAGDEAAKELLGQGLGQAAARLGGLVDDHGAVEQVGAVGPEGQTHKSGMEHRTKGPQHWGEEIHALQRWEGDDSWTVGGRVGVGGD